MKAAILTPRQTEVLNVIRKLSAAGINPTQDEVTAAIGVRGSVATRRYLDILERRGFIAPRPPRKRRTIRLTVAALAA